MLLAFLYLLELAATAVRPTRITFGSCHGLFNQTNRDIFQAIRSLSPDAFIWLGDIVYLDDSSTIGRYKTNSPQVWKAKYHALKSLPEYRRLRKTTRILGTWDDHDYGQNDAGKEFPLKAQTKEYLLDFLDEPSDSPRRSREGVYEAYEVGPIKIILLDNRSFRDEHDDLGPAQWTWLEEQLTGEAALYLIGSGLVTRFEHDVLDIYEHLNERTKQRLYSLIHKAGGKTLLLSGDVHFFAASENNCSEYPIIEVTSSGMSHHGGNYFGLAIQYYAQFLVPLTFNLTPRLFLNNFGLIDVDWATGVLRIQGLTDTGTVFFNHTFDLEYLTTMQQPSPYCTQAEHWLSHAVAMHCTFCLPAVLCIAAALIALRKYSHSY